MDTKQAKISCPHCGGTMFVQLDYSNGDQDFIDDCPNCCNPVHMQLHVDEAARKLDVSVSADDEQYY